MNIIHKFASVTIDRPLNELPNVHVLPQYIPHKTWPSSYKANNAFILPSLVKDGPTTCKGHGDGASCDATFQSGTTVYMTSRTRTYWILTDSSR